MCTPVLGFLVGCLLASGPAVSRAAEPPRGGDAAQPGRRLPGFRDGTKAPDPEALFAQAAAHKNAGDWAGALRVLRSLRATDFHDQRGVQWNIARCLEELGRHKEALAAFGEFLKMSGVDADPKRDEAHARVADLRKRLYGSLVVECADRRTRIQVHSVPNFQLLTSFPHVTWTGDACPHRSGDLDVGGWVVVASIDGRKIQQTSVKVEGGRERVVKIEAPAWLSVTSPVTGTKVSVDGKFIRVAPIESLALAPGKHRLSAEKEGHAAVEETLHLPAGQSTSWIAPLKPKNDGDGPLALALTGVGVAVFSGMFHFVSAEEEQSGRSADALFGVAVGGYVLGGTMFLSGLIWNAAQKN